MPQPAVQERSQELAKQSDQRLLEAIEGFVSAHRHPSVGRFRNAIADWGELWRPVPPAQLPAARLLNQALAHTTAETHRLTALFEQESSSRKWEQSYTKADDLVGQDMLAGYAFAEVIGKQGPFVSEKVRAGVGVWGPNIVYPPHRHQAEEVYVVLAGSAEFRLGAKDTAITIVPKAGEVVSVPSRKEHGFSTRTAPLVVFYIWQNGDLREKSDFT